MLNIGDRVRVIDQDITGTVVRYDTHDKGYYAGCKVVVLDDDRAEWQEQVPVTGPDGTERMEWEEGVLIFRESDLVKKISFKLFGED